jgi:hypothetical protein
MADLDIIMGAFTSTFESLRLWEYYVLNVEAEKAAVNLPLLRHYRNSGMGGRSRGWPVRG